MHYWNGVDDIGYDIVVLTPTSPNPNGFGVISIFSGGWGSKKAVDLVNEDALNPYQVYLRRGYTVFIVPHPPAYSLGQLGLKHSDPANHPVAALNPAAEPGYSFPEIREFIERSVIAVKTSPDAQRSVTNPLHGNFGWDSPESWAIVGASSGGHLASYVALTKAADRKTSEVIHFQTGLTIVDPANGNPLLVDTGVGAVALRAPGVDALNWRFLGDTSLIWRQPLGLHHADVSDFQDPTQPPGINLPAPTTLSLPTHLSPSKQFQLPTSTAPHDDALLASGPHTFHWPETYLKPETMPLPGPVFTTVQEGFWADPIDLAFMPSTTDPIVNGASLLSYYPEPPADWVNYLSGHCIVDLLDPTAPADTYPPVQWIQGDRDHQVPFFQLTRFKQVVNAMANPITLEEVITTGPGQEHGFRDMDRDSAEMQSQFIDRYVRQIIDSDDDGLVDGSDRLPNKRDIDGDGQPDGNEFEDNGNILTNEADSSKTFRITDVTSTSPGVLGAGSKKWELKLTFTGFSGNKDDYVVQACNWIFDDGLGTTFSPDQRYPLWKDFPNAGPITVSNAANNEYAVVVNRGVNAPAPEKFYRIALKGPVSDPYSRVATAPVGIERRIIRRRVGSTATANLICSGFVNEDVWRGRVSSPVVDPADPNRVILTLNSSLSTPISAPQASPPPPFMATELNRRYTHYAIIQKDADIENAPIGTIAFSDRGREGHWWYVHESSTNTVTLVQNGSPTGDILSIPDGSHLSIRRLRSLGDIFEGLEDTATPNHWHKHATVNGASNGSPMKDGDRIRIISRTTVDVDWAIPNSFMQAVPTADVELKFNAPSGQSWGTWDEDLVGTGTTVVLADIRLRPDEALEYLAVANSTASGEGTAIWTSGHVSTSDIMAYVDSNPRVWDPLLLMFVDWFPSQTSGMVYYSLSTIGWPFPHDTKLVTGADQSSWFFESGLVVENPHLLGSILPTGNLSSEVPPSDVGSVFLAFSDPYDDTWGMRVGGAFIQDRPNDMWFVWGGYTGQYQYQFEPRPFVRFLAPVNVTGFATSTTEEVRDPLRSARGMYAVANRSSWVASAPPTATIREWRLAKPYRRP